MNPLVQPDPGLFLWTIITFLVLLALLAKFAWGPLLQALDGRQQTILKALDDMPSRLPGFGLIMQALIESAQAMMVGGKSLLAMDESNGTCNQRFATAGIP